MSFGFSVGDILLASKLAYRLYSTITTGRRSAAKDLQELGDVLFGLRCALDHLGNAAKDIWATTSNTQDASAVEIRQKLATMVCSCSATLQELDSVTARYREATKSAESEVVNDDVEVVPAVGASTQPNRKPSMARFKDNVQVNWLKMRWSIERNSFSEYRARLQSHTDAINVVLNTLLWSATHRIEVDGRVNAEKLQEVQKLAQEIRTLRMPLPPAPAPEPSPRRPEIGQIGGLTCTVDSISHHCSPVAPMAIVPPPSSTPNFSTPLKVPLAMREKPSPIYDVSTPLLAVNPRSKRELPVAIVKLNIRRQLASSKAFEEYQKNYSEPKPPRKPSFFSLEIPTVPQLRHGLTYIFRPFPQSTAAGQESLNRDQRRKEIVRWAQGLDHLLDAWTSGTISSPSASKEAVQDKQNEMVDLLIGLNGSIETSDDDMKRLFYQGTEQAGTDRVLDRFCTVSGSVRAMKEVEEFEDVRDEWKDSQDGG